MAILAARDLPTVKESIDQLSVFGLDAGIGQHPIRQRVYWGLCVLGSPI